jgi:hypothetical protein
VTDELNALVQYCSLPYWKWITYKYSGLLVRLQVQCHARSLSDHPPRSTSLSRGITIACQCHHVTMSPCHSRRRLLLPLQFLRLSFADESRIRCTPYTRIHTQVLLAVRPVQLTATLSLRMSNPLSVLGLSRIYFLFKSWFISMELKIGICQSESLPFLRRAEAGTAQVGSGG